MYQVVPETGKIEIFFELLPTNKIQKKKQSNERDSCKDKCNRRQLNQKQKESRIHLGIKETPIQN